jgi:hypothetical protein
VSSSSVRTQSTDQTRPDARGALWRPESPVRIGVSSCLLGQSVRWDGGHKRDPFLVDTLGQFVEWVAVCPEVELGSDAVERCA